MWIPTVPTSKPRNAETEETQLSLCHVIPQPLVKCPSRDKTSNCTFVKNQRGHSSQKITPKAETTNPRFQNDWLAALEMLSKPSKMVRLEETREGTVVEEVVEETVVVATDGDVEVTKIQSRTPKLMRMIKNLEQCKTNSQSQEMLGLVHLMSQI